MSIWRSLKDANNRATLKHIDGVVEKHYINRLDPRKWFAKSKDTTPLTPICDECFYRPCECEVTYDV